MERLAIEGGKPVCSTRLPYGRQWLAAEDIAEVVQVLQGDWITQGPKIGEFEETLASRVGAKYAVAFSSGTAALHAACFAAGIGEGDEVITTPITFAASANCVLYMRGTPVFADIEEDTYNLAPNEVEKKITSRTKAIIPVDFAGQPVELDEFRELAAKHRLTVIEDAAHALGASYKGKSIGSLADMTMFSFHPVKAITTGEGGAVTTDQVQHYRRLSLFRNHGVTRDRGEGPQDGAPWYYEMRELGYNYRITDFQCALGLKQLEKLEGFIERRREIARLYEQCFKEIPEIITPQERPWAKSAWHIYVIRLRLDRLRAGRRQVFEALQAENIGVNVHYIPVYYHPYYQRLGYRKGSCPRAERYYEEAITLPLFPRMTEQEAQDVVSAVRKVLGHYRLSRG